jgi:hypothetical protein
MTKFCPHCGLSLDDVTEEPETTEIKKAIRDYFRLTPMWIDQKDLQFIAWARKEKITRQQIERAARAWKENKQLNWKAPTLKDIALYWMDLASEIRISADDVGIGNERKPDRTSLIKPMGDRTSMIEVLQDDKPPASPADRTSLIKPMGNRNISADDVGI